MKRADHPEFHEAWEIIQQEMGILLNLAHRDHLDRDSYEHQIEMVEQYVHHLKTLIPAQNIAVGNRVLVTCNNGFKGKTGTVVQTSHTLALVKFHRDEVIGTAFQLTDLEPAE